MELACTMAGAASLPGWALTRVASICNSSSAVPLRHSRTFRMASIATAWTRRPAGNAPAPMSLLCARGRPAAARRIRAAAHGTAQ